jgi:hypothetical protein
VARAQAADTKTAEPTNAVPESISLPVPYSLITPTPYAVGLPAEIPVEVIPTQEILPFLYFSEYSFGDQKTQDRNKNKSKLSEIGCGVIVGGMAIRRTPNDYMQEFFKYFESIGKYGPARITENGSDMEDHLLVLQEWLLYRPENLVVEGSTVESIKLRIKELTAQGIPVWINTGFYHNPHHSMAVGIAEDGSIIFNDPLWGEGVKIPDNKIEITDKNGNMVWKVYAIFPPAQ